MPNGHKRVFRKRGRGSFACAQQVRQDGFPYFLFYGKSAVYVLRKKDVGMLPDMQMAESQTKEGKREQSKGKREDEERN